MRNCNDDVCVVPGAGMFEYPVHTEKERGRNPWRGRRRRVVMETVSNNPYRHG